MAEHASSNLGKYESGNPVVKGLMARYGRVLDALVLARAPASVLDVGSGEGFTARRLAGLPISFDYRGVELDPSAVAYARAQNPGLVFEQGSLYELTHQADLVLCLEVLEHLEDPARGVDALADATRRHVVVSVPWEPWFRLGNLARGKYLDRLGNHPEHIQQFGPKSIAALLERRFTNVKVHTAWPWVFATGDKR